MSLLTECALMFSKLQFADDLVSGLVIEKSAN